MNRHTVRLISTWFDITCIAGFGVVTVVVGFDLAFDPARMTWAGADPVGAMVLACGAWALIHAVRRAHRLIWPTYRYRVVDPKDSTVRIVPVDPDKGTFTIEKVNRA